MVSGLVRFAAASGLQKLARNAALLLNFKHGTGRNWKKPLRRSDARERSTDVLLITDGDIWDAEEVIRSAQRSGHRVFTIGVGSAPAESLLREIAEKTGGACELASPNQDVGEVILRLAGAAQFDSIGRPDPKGGEPTPQRMDRALRYQLVADLTNLILVHVREHEDKATGLCVLEQIAHIGTDSHRLRLEALQHLRSRLVRKTSSSFLNWCPRRAATEKPLGLCCSIG